MTITTETLQSIRKQLQRLCFAARSETFQDGIQSHFARNLVDFIQKYGNPAIDALSDMMTSHTIENEVAYEALRCIGRMNHPETHPRRLRLLAQSLQNPSLWIRDGASLGLASLDDPYAIPFLRKAIAQEPCDSLREDMKQVLSELESTHLCHSF